MLRLSSGQWSFEKPMVPWVILVRRVYFPEELIAEILETFDTDDPKGRRALRACLRVSQQLRSISLRLAYKTVRGYSRIEGPDAFLPVIQHFTIYASIAHTVTTLILSASTNIPWSTPSSLPSTDICILTTIGSILYRLQKLRLYRVALRPCACPTHSHRWTSGFHLRSLELQCVNLPMSTTINIGHLLLAISIDVLTIGSITVLEDFPLSLTTRPSPQLPFPGSYTLSINAVEVFPGTCQALRRLTELKIDNLTSLQLGDVDWTAWRNVQSLLKWNKATLKTLALCMGIMDDENVQDPEAVWQPLPWKACTTLHTAVLSMIFHDRQTLHITSSQLQWFMQWMERLPPSASRIRMVMDCTQVIDQNVLEEWLEVEFPWKFLATELSRRPEVEVVEVEVVHDFFAWEDILEGSSAEAYLQKEIIDGRVRLLESDWHPFPEEV